MNTSAVFNIFFKMLSKTALNRFLGIHGRCYDAILSKMYLKLKLKLFVVLKKIKCTNVLSTVGKQAK